MSRRIKSLWLGMLALCLCQCGYHLRGMAPLPPAFQEIYIIAPNEARNLKAELEEELESFHVQVCKKQSQAHFEIVIDDINFARQVSNISSSTTPRQYQLIYTVNYHFVDSSQQQTVIPSAKLSATRLVTMNNERLLGSNYEQDFFLQEMQEEIARQMISTISHYFELHRLIPS